MADGHSHDDDRIEQLRTPPQSVEAEQSVIGGLMLDPTSIWRVMDVLLPEAFYRRDHRLIYQSIIEMHAAGKAFDVVTLGDWIHANGRSQDVGERGYLIDLASTTPSAANITAYAEIVREKYLLRMLIEAGTDVVNEAFTPGQRTSMQLLGNAQARLARVLQGQPSELESPAKVIDELIAESVEADEKPVIRGLTTGLIDLDAILGGLRPGQLIVIGGRPKMGKSTLAQNIAEHVALRLKKRVAIHSLEMTPKELVQRSICSLGKIDANRLRHNALEQEEWTRWSKITGVIRNAPLVYSGPRNARVEQLIAQTQREHAQRPLSLMIVDYLQLMDLSGFNGSRNDAIGNVTRQLKMLAGAMGIPVILLSQLSRKLEERPDKRPMMADLRDSGNIEQDADAIVFVYRDEVYHPGSTCRGTAELIVRAQRSGRPDTARVMSELDQYRFDNLAPGWEPLEVDLDAEPHAKPKRRRFRSTTTEAPRWGDA